MINITIGFSPSSFGTGAANIRYHSHGTISSEILLYEIQKGRVFVLSGYFEECSFDASVLAPFTSSDIRDFYLT